MLVPLGALGELRAALTHFDGQTHQDVTSLSHRVSGTERQLTGLLNQTEALREELQECALERDERQEFKKALMEVLHVAVKTSIAPPQQLSMEGTGEKPGFHPQGKNTRIVNFCLVANYYFAIN